MSFNANGRKMDLVHFPTAAQPLPNGVLCICQFQLQMAGILFTDPQPHISPLLIFYTENKFFDNIHKLSLYFQNYAGYTLT